MNVTSSSSRRNLRTVGIVHLVYASYPNAPERTRP